MNGGGEHNNTVQLRILQEEKRVKFEMQGFSQLGWLTDTSKQ